MEISILYKRGPVGTIIYILYYIILMYIIKHKNFQGMIQDNKVKDMKIIMK